MDARQLGYFLAIVDHGGFARAADHLHLAQPSLSQAMAGLERDLGVKLFRRSGRGVTLTDPGHQLIGPARQVVRDLEAARSVVADTRDLRHGRVDLVTMPSPGIEPLTQLLTRFSGAHPGLSVNVDGVFTADEVVTRVRSGTSEVGLLGAAGRVYTGDLATCRLGDQALVLVSPPRDALTEHDVVTAPELAGEPIVAAQRGSLMRQWVDDRLADGVALRVVAEVAHRTSLLPFVMSGLGHAVVPDSWAHLAEAAGARVRRLEPVYRLRVTAVWRTQALTPGGQAFVETLRELGPSLTST